MKDNRFKLTRSRGRTLAAFATLAAATLAIPLWAQDKADRPDLGGVPDKPHLEEDETAGQVERPAASDVDVPNRPQPKIMNPGWEHGGVPWKFRVSDAPVSNLPGVGTYGEFEGYLEKTAARTGRRGYAIRGSTDADPSAFAELYNDARFLMPGRMYRINFWVRGKDVGEAYLRAGTPKSSAARRLPEGDFDWTLVTLDFTAGPGEERVPVSVVAYGPTGELNIDDVGVELSPLQEAVLGRPEADETVDVAEPTVAMDRSTFDVLEQATGRFLQPRGQGTGGVLRMRMTGPESMPIGRVRVPLDANASGRSVPFAIPLAGLPDGEYTVVATLDNQPAGTATFTRINLDDRIAEDLASLRKEIEATRQEATEAGVADDAYINMGLALLDRFATRVETGGQDRNQNRHWDRLQMEEMREVLAETRRDIEQRKSGPALHGEVKLPAGGRYEIVGDDVMMPVEGGGKATYFPIGYGHFVKVRRDIPNHLTWGATVIQQGAGMGMLQPDGTLKEPKGEVPQILAEAEAANVKIDFLTGAGIPPRVMDDKSPESHPDLFVRNVGFIPHNIDHPLHKEWAEKWLRAIVPLIKDSPAIGSICLSNEPAYAWSGRDRYSRPLFEQFLKDLHGDIETANTLWETDYASFGDVPIPIPEPIEPYNHKRPPNGPQKRLYYDYLMFHQGHFTEWHRNLDRIVNEEAPGIATHIKTVGPAVIGQNVLHWGVDPEAYADFTEIAGLDTHFWEHGPNSPYAFDWVNGYLAYDLFHSFRGQPVFNSENHVLRDNQQTRAPRNHTYAAMFQGALHNGRMSAMWVWEAPLGGALGGNISIRPASIYEHGRAAFDLSRLNKEIDALATTPRRVALMYSPTSVIWESDYQAATKQAWAGLTTIGEPVHFVTERQLTEGRVPDSITHIVLQRVTHAKDETVDALADWVEQGGVVLKTGDGVLERDHYGRERDLPESLANARTITLSNEHNPAAHREAAAAFRDALTEAGLELIPLKSADGGVVEGVDYRATDFDGGRLIALTNMMRGSKAVSLGEGEAVDLITGETVNLSSFELESVKPRVLRIEGERAQLPADNANRQILFNPVQNPGMWLGHEHWDLTNGNGAKIGDETKTGDGWSLRADPDILRGSPRSLRLISAPEASGVARAIQTVESLEPDRSYVATLWVRGEAVPEGAAFIAGDARTDLPAGDFDWKEVTLTGRTSAGVATFPVGVEMPAKAGATLWIEDASIDLAPDEAAVATVEGLPDTLRPVLLKEGESVDTTFEIGDEKQTGRLTLADATLRLSLDASAANKDLRPQLDPTPSASRLMSYEERQQRAEAAATAEVINRPIAERRDLYNPAAFGTIDPGDAVAKPLKQDGDRLTAEWSMPNPTASLSLSAESDPARRRLIVKAGSTPALIPTATHYDASERLDATLVVPSADTVRFKVDGEVVAETDMTASDQIVRLRLPLQRVANGTHTLTATVGEETVSVDFTRGDRRGGVLAEAERLQQVSTGLADRAKAADVDDHALVNLGLATADRFIDRVRTGGPDNNQGFYWSQFQMREVDQILQRTQSILEKLEAGHEWPGTFRRQTNAELAVSGSTVVGEATPFADPDASPDRGPLFPMGYGHFMKVARDLPNYPDLGASIIQQGHGPPLYREDGTFPDDLGGIRDALDAAEANRMKIDYLTGNGLPKWVAEANADDDQLLGIPVAFIKYNLDHPLLREWTGRFVAEMLPQIKDSPALATVCIVNEPAYVLSGRDKYSRPAWTDYLRRQHGDVAALNELYGTDHPAFEDVAPPPWRAPRGEIRENLPVNRAYYDWAMFNREHFGQWHQWMHDTVKAAAPDVLTHAKVMADTVFSRRLAYKGTDPELICDATDLAGVDAWHFEKNSMADPYSVDDYAYQWQWPLIGYDLFHSFSGQPVFNSENHIIRDGGRRHTRDGHLYTAHWQGALHNCRLSTMWVWEEAAGGGLAGNVSYRPLDVYDAGRAMFDLNRLANEVDALANAPEDVAILYSSTSLIWQPGYDVAVKRGWTALANLGLPTTFVTDRQLQAGTAAKVKVILLPRTSYLHDETVAALERFVEGGGTVIAVGDDVLRYDEYGRERDLPEALAKLPTVELDDVEPFEAERRATLSLLDIFKRAGLPGRPLLTIDGDMAIGVARRGVVLDDGASLLALTNMRGEPQTLRVSELDGEVLDLLSGEQFDLGSVTLEPLRPVLLKIEPQREVERDAFPALRH